MKISIRRTAALTLAALPLTMLGLLPSAQAAVVGHLKLEPATGNQGTILDIDTLTHCPVGSAFVSVEMFGAGINPDDGFNILTGTTDLNPSNTPDNQYGGFHVAVTGKFFDVFQASNILAPNGDYTLSVVCRDGSAVATDTIDATVTFTHTAGAANYTATYVQQSNAVTTSTVLGSTPADPFISGTSSHLTATVTPSDAAGTIQFKRAGVNIGAAQPVVAGAASLDYVLPAGTNAVTAVFLPTSTDAFKTSTGSASIAVAGPTTIAGVAKVGNTLTCAATTGGTLTYHWSRNGVVSSVTTKTVVAPASWLNATITCALTSTKGGTAVTRTSPGVKVLIGAAPVAKVKPSLAGIYKVGKIITCRVGTWSPKPTSYKYQWLRAGKPITGGTKSTYKLVRADKGKLVSCKVTAVLAGHTNGVSTSAAKKIA